MPRRGSGSPTFTVSPLTPDRFPDLERLFGPRGASSGCWCMWWRIPRARFDADRGERNRAAFRRYVEGGDVPGLLAYDGDRPIGWIAVEPRKSYPRLAASRSLAPVDEAPVWSITCFFVDRAYRGRGVTRLLVEAAAAHARAAGATLLEAYPREPGEGEVDTSLYTGVASTFRELGFEEVARRSPRRPMVRLALASRPGPPGRGRAPGRSRPRSSPRRGSRSRTGR
jgi:GNAT superfamily N-acetyltransferase